jgi:SAM-dependent methyltransferase
MEAAVLQRQIQRQYDDVIAGQYDRDPQSTTGNSLDRAIDQLSAEGLLSEVLPAMRVLDIGMGTGMFLEKLRRKSPRAIEPFGIDVSRQMLTIATAKLPDLTAMVDDGINLNQHFRQESFDLIATHFVTGFVPITRIAPQIHEKLVPGGIWSFVGGTTAGYPVLQRRAAHPLLKLFFGHGSLSLQDQICPADEQDIARAMLSNGFELLTLDTYEPELRFPNFDSFMEYAYHGGWLTPFIEQIGLHKAKKWQQAILNQLVFPVVDHHRIAFAVARKKPD